MELKDMSNLHFGEVNKENYPWLSPEELTRVRDYFWLAHDPQGREVVAEDGDEVPSEFDFVPRFIDAFLKANGEGTTVDNFWGVTFSLTVDEVYFNVEIGNLDDEIYPKGKWSAEELRDFIRDFILGFVGPAKPQIQLWIRHLPPYLPMPEHPESASGGFFQIKICTTWNY